jgi:hypothetical protein
VENKTDEQTRLLVHVKYAAAAMDECMHSLHQAVERARAAGATWSQISELLKTSEQAAEKEFSGAGQAERVSVHDP